MTSHRSASENAAVFRAAFDGVFLEWKETTDPVQAKLLGERLYGMVEAALILGHTELGFWAGRKVVNRK